MITAILISLCIGVCVGFYAGVKNADSSKVSKAKSVIEELKK